MVRRRNNFRNRRSRNNNNLLMEPVNTLTKSFQGQVKAEKSSSLSIELTGQAGIEAFRIRTIRFSSATSSTACLRLLVDASDDKDNYVVVTQSAELMVGQSAKNYHFKIPKTISVFKYWRLTFDSSYGDTTVAGVLTISYRGSEINILIAES